MKSVFCGEWTTIYSFHDLKKMLHEGIPWWQNDLVLSYQLHYSSLGILLLSGTYIVLGFGVKF